MGFKDPVADVLEEREHQEKMKAFREEEIKLKEENDKLIRSNMIEHQFMSRNPRMAATASAGFGAKKDSMLASKARVRQLSHRDRGR